MFSPAEADSILATLDGQASTIRLLRVDLAECRELARVDSLRLETQLRLEHESWWQRAIKNPIAWWAVGLYMGLKVGARI